MKRGGKGGARTGTGLRFERRLSLAVALRRIPGYAVVSDRLIYHGKVVANICGKRKLYSDFLEPRGVHWDRFLSKRLFPDEAIYVPSQNRMFIIEMKFQQTEGSVDEKLQTCDFKKRQYQRLFEPMGIKVEYWYVLGRWFKDPRYRDVLEYIRSVGCRYFFEELPISELGLPVPPP